jgi:DNA replication protein DnaC
MTKLSISFLILVTSNKTLPEISEIYGDHRITSRIERICEGQMIEKLNWRDTV